MSPDDLLKKLHQQLASTPGDLEGQTAQLWSIYEQVAELLPTLQNPLDLLARRSGTDKSSDFHNFARYYYHHFASRRLQVRKILEIGIFHGASIQMWAEFFPNAVVFGLDNDPECFQAHTDRIQTILGPQEDRDFLSRMVQQTGGDFDIIIDDGGHRMHEQIASFEVLFPTLKPGGIYVFEDLHTSYWDFCGGGYKKPGTAIETIKDLVDQMNIMGRVDCGDPERAIQALEEKFPDRPLRYFEKHLASIHLYKSIAFLIKR